MFNHTRETSSPSRPRLEASKSRAGLVALIPDDAVIPASLRTATAMQAGDLIHRLSIIFKRGNAEGSGKVVLVPFAGHELEALVPLSRVTPLLDGVYAIRSMAETDVVWLSASQSLGAPDATLESLVKMRSLSASGRDKTHVVPEDLDPRVEAAKFSSRISRRGGEREGQLSDPRDRHFGSSAWSNDDDEDEDLTEEA